MVGGCRLEVAPRPKKGKFRRLLSSSESLSSAESSFCSPLAAPRARAWASPAWTAAGRTIVTAAPPGGLPWSSEERSPPGRSASWSGPPRAWDRPRCSTGGIASGCISDQDTLGEWGHPYIFQNILKIFELLRVPGGLPGRCPGLLRLLPGLARLPAEPLRRRLAEQPDHRSAATVSGAELVPGQCYLVREQTATEGALPGLRGRQQFTPHQQIVIGKTTQPNLELSSFCTDSHQIITKACGFCLSSFSKFCSLLVSMFTELISKLNNNFL